MTLVTQLPFYKTPVEINSVFYTTSNLTVVATSTAAQVNEVYSLPYSALEATLIGISVTLLWILIVAGNILVLVAISTDYRLRSVQNWFLGSLAVADLMLGVLILPLSAVNELLGRWVFGRLLCSLWLAIDVLLCTASIMHLCLISIDRYYSVIRPIQYKTSSTPARILGMICAAWIISGIICLPPLFGWSQPKYDGNFNQSKPHTCELTQNTAYVVYSTSGSFFIPLLIIIIVYSQVYRQAKMRTQRIIKKKTGKPYLDTTNTTKMANCQVNSNSASLTGQESSSASTGGQMNQKHRQQYSYQISKMTSYSTIQDDDVSTLSTSALPLSDITIENNNNNNINSNSNDNERENNRYRSRSIFAKLAMRKSKLVRHRERRTIVVLGVVVGAFVFCWLPFFTTYLLVIFCGCVDMKLFNFFFWLGYCNSALNPIIYTVYNRDFRKAFQKLLYLQNCHCYSIHERFSVVKSVIMD